MYLFGGYDGKYRRGQLFAFEIVGVSNERIDCVWRKVETQGHGPASRYTHSGASIGSQLIVYGGNTGCLKGDAYVLDLGTGEEIPTWKLAKCDPPLTPRAWHRAVVYNDAISSGSGSASVEFWSVGDGSASRTKREEDVASSANAGEIQFPTIAKVESGKVIAGAETASNTDKYEIVASPVATEPLLVLSAMAASTRPPSESPAKKGSERNGDSQEGSESVMQEVEMSTVPPEAMHGVPSNPTLVNAVGFDGRAAVTWKAPDDDGLDSIVAYEVGWFDEEDNVLVGTQRVTSSSVNFVGQTLWSR
uniref:Fibronectin type-III domain-containing protein n=1 Tax=Phytophthora ramorum TaxID=164328 RepID=H3GG38_PHYRM